MPFAIRPAVNVVAVADLKSALERKPDNIFDVMAQVEARKRLQLLTRQAAPCGSGTSPTERCL